MRQIANLFLILFLAAAGLGILTELLNPSGLNTYLSGLRGLAGLSLFLVAVPVYFGLGLNRHLAKALFVPLLGYLLWGLLDFWPLETLAGSHYRLYAFCAQLLLGLLALREIRRQNGESQLLMPSQFEGPGFSGGNLLRFCLVGIPLLPLILLLLGYASAGSLIEEYTAGFVRLKPNGLYMIEKVYALNDKEIRLAGMIHMGREDYYAELADSFNDGDALLLAEGVSDTKGLLKDRFSYGRVADLLGLASQEKQPFPGRLVDAASLDQPLSAAAGTPDILRADIDLQNFDPRTLKVLNAISRYLLNSRSLSTGYREFSNWAERNITPETNQILMTDLLEKRNQAVLGYLTKGLRKYRTLLIPWGALHMPGLEAAVKARGFTWRESRERLSIDFFSLPYARLWKNLIGVAAGRAGIAEYFQGADEKKPEETLSFTKDFESGLSPAGCNL